MASFATSSAVSAASSAAASVATSSNRAGAASSSPSAGTSAVSPASSAIPATTANTSAAAVPTSSAAAAPTAAAPTNAAPTTSAAAAAPTAAPPSTVITITPTINSTPTVVVITSTSTPTDTATLISTTSSSSTSSTSSSDTAASVTASPTAVADSSSGGLSNSGRIAIAVVVPIVVVALLAAGLIYLWRKRKQRRDAEEQRRAEVEEYSFNPNRDPSFPINGTAVGAGAVGATAATYGEDGHSDMRETGQGGYRGWGTMGARTNTNGLSPGPSSGPALSDHGKPGSPVNGVTQPSPSFGGYSEAHSADHMLARPDTVDSSPVAPLGAAPLSANNTRNVHRGPSNASSSYSMGKTSELSGEAPRHEIGMAHDGLYEPENGQRVASHGDQYYDNGQPVQRDTSGRRTSRLDNMNAYPQGNSGIAMNF